MLRVIAIDDSGNVCDTRQKIRQDRTQRVVSVIGIERKDFQENYRPNKFL